MQKSRDYMWTVDDRWHTTGHAYNQLRGCSPSNSSAHGMAAIVCGHTFVHGRLPEFRHCPAISQIGRNQYAVHARCRLKTGVGWVCMTDEGMSMVLVHNAQNRCKMQNMHVSTCRTVAGCREQQPQNIQGPTTWMTVWFGSPMGTAEVSEYAIDLPNRYGNCSAMQGVAALPAQGLELIVQAASPHNIST